MRLNHVKLFYTFLLHFHSEGDEEKGWPATARPLQGRSQAARATSKGGRTAVAAARGQAAWAAARGQAARAVAGAALARGQAVVVALARGQPARGDGCSRPARKGRCPQRCRPRATTLAVGVAANGAQQF
ncbi:hypothetical protein GW17_00044453 [Ensete ventricosum]|nr:hypothetical protein GW17_00044453 [Ensete ventricosum]